MDSSALDDICQPRVSPLRIHVIIVGCGLGGLSAAYCLAKAGHEVTIFEAATTIGEVGAGIQVSPNASRLLIRWGLGESLERLGVRPEGIQFLRYSTGERVGYTKWGDDMDQLYGAPYYHLHRADLHKMLYDITIPLPNVTLRTSSRVIHVDTQEPFVRLENGDVIRGHVIVGADGVKSLVQTAVLGAKIEARATGDAAYRAIVPTSIMNSDTELKPLVDNPMMTAWMAPGRHMMGYNIRSKQEYNIVLLHPDSGSVESWCVDGNVDQMRSDFSDFEPRVQRLLSHVHSTQKWKLMDRPPLPTWIHSSHKIVLLGDACHPMLPYRAQGAAMAIEDAAVLGNLLSGLSAYHQIPALLRAYQELRLYRTTEVQSSSRLNQKIFHLQDGEEQMKRDEDMRRAMRGEVSEGSSNQWADKSKSRELFGYDADQVVLDMLID